MIRGSIDGAKLRLTDDLTTAIRYLIQRETPLRGRVSVERIIAQKATVVAVQLGHRDYRSFGITDMMFAYNMEPIEGLLIKVSEYIVRVEEARQGIRDLVDQ